MKGAQSLLRTLVASGVDTCFMNPGTSEMHFVAALDDVPEMRGVLALFEGVATAAADGYGRMADGPASVLLHLGPGLGNGIANLHNARRAATPVVALVGDHATYHKQYDAPLESDIPTLAANFSEWVRRPVTTDQLAADAAEAVAASMGPPGQVTTLIVPADVSWSEGGGPVPPAPRRPPNPPDDNAVKGAAAALKSGEPCALLIGGRACRGESLEIAGSLGAKVFCETFPARLERGAGRVPVERLAYLGEMAIAQLDGLRHLILVDAKAPVSFFAYPGKPSNLVPDSCQLHALAGPAEDVTAALQGLAAEVGAGPVVTAASGRPEPPHGALTVQALGAAIGAVLPEGAIVCDEANTSGVSVAGATSGCPPHDWLTLTGGAIGIGLPLAVGAAVACPERRVVALEADGSAMYTAQALWTMAREDLDVTTVIAANRSYAILNMELKRVGASAGGPRSRAMLDLSRPVLDFVSLARGMGVSATRAETAEDLVDQLRRALSTPGPSLVEAVVIRM
jgi:acetolactate synthase-1/2/3 large subunit